MMDWLLNLIPGGSLGVYAAAAAAALLALWRMWAGIKKSGVDQQLAKEAKAREKNIDRIADAAGAKPVDSVSDDPDNRDNWPGRT